MTAPPSLPTVGRSRRGIQVRTALSSRPSGTWSGSGSTSPRNRAGLTAASHQRTGTRHRTIRAPRSASPGRPAVQAVTATAAIAGPSSAGRCVGQAAAWRTTRWPAASGMTHDQLSPYASPKKHKSAATLRRDLPRAGSRSPMAVIDTPRRTPLRSSRRRRGQHRRANVTTARTNGRLRPRPHGLSSVFRAISAPSLAVLHTPAAGWPQGRHWASRARTAGMPRSLGGRP